MALDSKVYDFIYQDLAQRLNNPESIYTLHSKIKKFDSVPSGVSVVDEVLCGGIPRGRITEIFGPEASGKTTLMLSFIAEAQRRGDMVYFIDAEHALDVDYAARIGVDVKSLLFCQPEYGEEALDTVSQICDSIVAATEKFGKKINALVVIDSVPALIPKQAFDVYADEKKEGLETTVALGLTATMLSRLLPVLVGKIARSNIALVFINQERDAIGVMYGSPTTTPGGRALKFFSSLRLKVSRCGFHEVAGQKIGIKTRMLPIKSKLFPIFGKQAEFIIGPNGINMLASFAETIVAKGIAKKSGSWLNVGDRKFQGIIQLEDELRNDKIFLKEMEQLIAQQGGQSKPIELKPKVVVEGTVQPSDAVAKSSGVSVTTTVGIAPTLSVVKPVGIPSLGAGVQQIVSPISLPAAVVPIKTT